MKLVNIHSSYFILLLIAIGFQSAQAQVWSLQQCIDTAQLQTKDERSKSQFNSESNSQCRL